MQWIVIGVSVFLLLTWQRKFTIRKALQALKKDKQWLSDDLGLYNEGDVRLTFRLVNRFVSVFYFQTKVEGFERESIDIVVDGLSGGLHAFFSDGKLVRVTLNGLTRDWFSPQEEADATELLTAVKFWAANAEPEPSPRSAGIGC